MTMRKTLALFAILCAMTASAQSEKGKLSLRPMAGVNISSFVRGEDVYKSKVGFTGGAEAEYGLSDNLGLSLGVMYSRQGAKIDGSQMLRYINEQGNEYIAFVQMGGKLVAEYLNLPLMANFYIPQIKGLSVKAGVQLGLLVGDKIDAVTHTVTTLVPKADEVPMIIKEGDPFPTQSVTAHMTRSEVCKSVDFGIPVGLAYEFKNVTLDARYYFGLTKVDDTEDGGSERNRCLSITLGYRFHM